MLQRLHDLLDRVYCFSILTLTLFESSSDTNQVKVYTLSCRALNARLQFPKPNLNRCVLQYFRWRKGLNNQTFEHRMLLHHHSPSHSTVNKLFWSQLLHYIPGKLIHILMYGGIYLQCLFHISYQSPIVSNRWEPFALTSQVVTQCFWNLPLR